MFHPQGPTLVELLQQAMTSTERGYDLLASKFNFTPFRTPDEVLKPFFEHVFQNGPVHSALDVACGTGPQLRFVSPHVKQRLTGVDFSQGMLDEARTQLSDLTPPPELLRLDARKLTFDQEFELVTSAGAFGHFVGPDEDLLLDGIRRALVKGGRFVFITFPMPSAVSPSRWVAHGFNAAMHLRNALVKPPFVMFYLTFTWPAVGVALERHGFTSTAHEGFMTGRYAPLIAVTATRR